MEEKLLALKIEIKKMEELWEQKQNEQAFQLFLKNREELNEFLLWIEQEQIIAEADYRQLVMYLLQAIENKDSVLLQDVILYAILDIINQLFATNE